MNILIPDTWLREFVRTKATPEQIRECLSLCGPSVERINTVDGEAVYDIEVTTNRVDSFSVSGIAREAATILPRFGIDAELVAWSVPDFRYGTDPVGIDITDASGFCRRMLAVVIRGITLGPSPDWLAKRLVKVGQRPLNSIVDITNYVMWELGQPSHAFDYDRLTRKRIVVREARKGEQVISLDGRRHVMVGGELVFDDGTGTIIDIPGVMGTANTVVTPETKNVLLFIENSEPSKIRFTSMTHAIRTQAAVINEKDPDPESAKRAMVRATALAVQLTGGKPASRLMDIYPKKFKSYRVGVTREKLDTYIGIRLPDAELSRILTTLDFGAKIDKNRVTVSVPSTRRDIGIDVNIIEEIARIHGYHHIDSVIPDGTLPLPVPDPVFAWEHEIKIRLRDWGYTELLTYSMLSKKQLEVFGVAAEKTYRITNPLSDDLVYMRTSLQPGVLSAIADNLKHEDAVRVFELSNVYPRVNGSLPQETPMLMVAWSGNQFFTAKGLAEAVFGLFGIGFPRSDPGTPMAWIDERQCLSLGDYGSVGIIRKDLTNTLGISGDVTVLDLNIARLVRESAPTKRFSPIPRYPPAVEDLAFVVDGSFQTGPAMALMKSADLLVSEVTLLDVFENIRTFHVLYRDPTRNLTAGDIAPVRGRIIELMRRTYGAQLKQSA